MKTYLLTPALLLGFIFTLNAQEIQDWSWAKTLAYGNMPRNAKNAARVEHVDKNGNYYVSSVLLSSGNTTRPDTKLFFNTDSIIVGENRQGIFLQKYDSTGTLLWSKTGICAKTFWPNPGNISGIETDNSGNLFVSLHFYDTLVLGIDTFYETGDKAQVNLVCFDANTGTLKWNQSLLNAYHATNSADKPHELTRIDLNAQQEVVAMVLNPENDSLTIFRYSNAGAPLLKKTTNINVVNGFRLFSLDASGPNILIAGASLNTFNVGSASVDLTHGKACIISFDASGDLKWVRQIKSTEPGFTSDGSKCYDLTQDAAGNIYFTGEFWGTFTMSGTTITFSTTGKVTSGGDDGGEVYYGMLDASGTAQWIRQCGGERKHGGRQIKFGSNGKLYVMGQLGSRTMFIGGDSIIAPSGGASSTNRYFIAELDNNGNATWAKRVNSPGAITGTDVYFHLDGENNIYFSGGFEVMPPTFGSHNVSIPGIHPDLSVFFVARSGERRGTSGGNTGINKRSIKKTFSAYPNPATHTVTIDLAGSDFNITNTNIILFDIQGKEVFEKQITAIVTQVNVESLQKGVYFLKVENKEKAALSKLVIN